MSYYLLLLFLSFCNYVFTSLLKLFTSYFTFRTLFLRIVNLVLRFVTISCNCGLYMSQLQLISHNCALMVTLYVYIFKFFFFLANSTFNSHYNFISCNREYKKLWAFLINLNLFIVTATLISQSQLYFMLLRLCFSWYGLFCCNCNFIYYNVTLYLTIPTLFFLNVHFIWMWLIFFSKL